MKQETYDQLKAICEKDGFEVTRIGYTKEILGKGQNFVSIKKQKQHTK